MVSLAAIDEAHYVPSPEVSLFGRRFVGPGLRRGLGTGPISVETLRELATLFFGGLGGRGFRERILEKASCAASCSALFLLIPLPVPFTFPSICTSATYCFPRPLPPSSLITNSTRLRRFWPHSNNRLLPSRSSFFYSFRSKWTLINLMTTLRVRS